MSLSIRFAAAAATAAAGLLLAACGTAGPAGPVPSTPPASAPATPPVSGPATTAAPTPAPSPSAAPVPFGYQPLFPFSNLSQVRAWQAAYAEGGHQPWHNNAAETARAFAAWLGFRDITEIAGQTGNQSDAHVAVGLRLPNGKISTAAIVHLVRYGSGRYVPWEVVGTDDTLLTLDIPAYGSTVSSPVKLGGTITGVDESLKAEVHAPGVSGVVGSYCCRPAGGQRTPWSLTVPFRAPSGNVITIVVFTGGHVATVERFAVTGVRVR